MSLIDKLSRTVRNTAGALVLGSVLYTSGCAAVTAGAQLWQADSMSRMAKTMENGQRQKVHERILMSEYDGSLVNNKNYIETESFRIQTIAWKDLNANGVPDNGEIYKFGEADFNTSEMFGGRIEVYGMKGRTLRIEFLGPKKQKLKEYIYHITNDQFGGPVFLPKKSILTGNNVISFAVDNRVLGTFEYTVTDHNSILSKNN